MWIIRLLLPTAILVLIIGFAFLNPDQKVEVDLFFTRYYEVQLAIVVLFSIFAGMLLMFALSVFHDLKIRGQSRRLRQENRRLNEELTTLRTSPFQDEDAREEAIG
jgi:uncharacterized integral membrane protein